MEKIHDGLNPYSTGNEVVGQTIIKENGGTQRAVLILILLEMRLLVNQVRNGKKVTTCLNPYSTGNEVVGFKQILHIYIS